MPSDVKASSPADPTQVGPGELDQTLVEPPSAKLLVRLFLIPLIIVALAVGVMFLIGRMAGGMPTMEEAIARLKRPGGGRTADWLVGPGAKQRYIDAKTLTDQMKAGMGEAERVALAGELIDILDNYTKSDEGQVQHFLLLALGRTWQRNPTQAAMNSPEAQESRQKVVVAQLRYADADDVSTRKAAVLSTVYWAGQDEAMQVVPMLIGKLSDPREDVDVRLAAATALGPLGKASDRDVIEALGNAIRDTDPRNSELVWASALSLAQLNQPDVAETVLKLLSRDELAKIEYYDRESDPKNPTFRKLSDQEQQRILINTMIGAKHLNVPAVQEKLRDLSKNDPSPRVRAAGLEILQTGAR
ncbi:MAG: HEAT repeat domain-containing protein [Tepidisphaeraceae bacterium]